MSDAAKYTLGIQFVAVGIVTLLVVGGLSNILFDDSNVQRGVQGATSIQVSPAPSSQSLQVREALGDPVPLDSPIQGTQDASQQDAAGELQQPTTTDQLQPNAKLSDFPENL